MSQPRQSESWELGTVQDLGAVEVRGQVAGEEVVAVDWAGGGEVSSACVLEGAGGREDWREKRISEEKRGWFGGEVIFSWSAWGKERWEPRMKKRRKLRGGEGLERLNK